MSTVIDATAPDLLQLEMDHLVIAMQEHNRLGDQIAFNASVVQALKLQAEWNRQQEERLTAIEAELRELKG